MCFQMTCQSYFSQEIGTDITQAMLVYGKFIGNFICSTVQAVEYK